MKQVKDLSFEEIKELAPKLEVWLGCYTDEVVMKVLSRLDEIINNEVVMRLINELYVRREQEKKERIDSFKHLISDFDGYKEFGIHISSLTHSKAYRDVLYDMFIQE